MTRLKCKVDDRRRAAKRRRAGGRLKGVRGARRPGVVVDMGMHIHAAGEHQQSGRLMDFRVGAQRGAESDDSAIFN